MGLKQALKPGQDRAALKLEGGVGPALIQRESEEPPLCTKRIDPGLIDSE